MFYENVLFGIPCIHKPTLKVEIKRNKPLLFLSNKKIIVKYSYSLDVSTLFCILCLALYYMEEATYSQLSLAKKR